MNLICGNVYVYHCTRIKRPHDKIGLCVSHRAPWFFWFNSTAAFHGQGQLQIAANEHAACSKDCFLDLSIIKTASADELVKIADRGGISDLLCARVIEALEAGVGPLADFQRRAVLKNLTPQIDS